jgi:hypothetical protein
MNNLREILDALETVAEGLQHFSKPVVYVGGSTVPLYLDPSDQIPARPTKDIDCVVEAITWLDYAKIETELRTFGFYDSAMQGAPRCRRVYRGIVIDLMPTEDALIGFSTKWYKEGFQNAQNYTLPSGRIIKLFTLPYFFLSKLEAIFDRAKDLRLSLDLEDIVTIIAGRQNVLNDLFPLKIELKTSFEKIIARTDFNEAIYGHLPASPIYFRNADEVLKIIYKLCGA